MAIDSTDQQVLVSGPASTFFKKLNKEYKSTLNYKHRLEVEKDDIHKINKPHDKFKREKLNGKQKYRQHRNIDNSY